MLLYQGFSKLIGTCVKPRIVFKALSKSLFLLAALIATQAGAQSYVKLYEFGLHNSGGHPGPGLLLLGNRLYGTTSYGGNDGQGGIFAMNTDGTAYTNFHSFPSYGGPPYTNSEGANPVSLIASGDKLYGTTSIAGTSSGGTIFTVSTNGSGFTNLHNFGAGTDGYYPSPLVLSGNTLYGETVDGGDSRFGMIFALNTDGTGFTNLHSFNLADGADPQGGLVLSGDRLFGITLGGGASDNGTVFSVKMDGTGFTNLHVFTGGVDGAVPVARLMLSSNTLYGTTSSGGAWTNGTVFAIGTDGQGFTNLYHFRPMFGSLISTNDDGGAPLAELLISGSVLYGTTDGGGNFARGTLFAMTTSGTDFTALHHFVFNGGTESRGKLVLFRNALYGTAALDTTSDGGAVFRLTLASPRLTITPSGANLVLQWPDNFTGFALQSTTNLASQPSTWDAITSTPVVISGQYTVTNAISGPQRLYRLKE
jgi:uncharacterized repeat protein (TIGR03803 family)